MTHGKGMSPRGKKDAPVVNPPEVDAKRGRPGLAPEVASRVRELMEEILAREPYVGHGGKTRLAAALKVTQPAVTQILGGGGVAIETAMRVAELAGIDPRDLLGGAYVGVAIGGKYPMLEVCLAYHPGRWIAPTVAVARAGLWPNDAAASEWAERLDAVQQSLAEVARSAHTPEVRPRTRS